MSNEYYIWIMGRISCDKWHGLKSVTRERGEELIAKYEKRYPINRYWLEPVEAMREAATELRIIAESKVDIITCETANTQFVVDLVSVAADLERYALQPVELALPPGECACKLPEESCIYCQPHTDELELI